MGKNLNRLMFILSLLGLAMAIYVLQSWLRESSIICLTGGCETVRKNPVSWPFGIPVPAVGLVGYLFLTILAFLRTAKLSIVREKLLLQLMLGMATFGILFVSWFTAMEVFVIKGTCTWCAISAVNMYVIFALVIRSYILENKRKV